MYPTAETIRHRLESKDHKFFRELGFETMAKMICDQDDEIKKLRARLKE